ncbi:hypothetical protein IAU60_006025 [Kwoniella sp. DSM 27419]
MLHSLLLLLPALSAFATSHAAAVSSTRRITVDNKCPSSIYVSVGSPDGPGVKDDGSAQEGSWMQSPGRYGFIVPKGWTNGRIWAQTGCEADANPLCKIGNCGGGVCNGYQYGTPGATLAEISLNKYANADFYDISMVDGYNLPMQIEIEGCQTASCGVERDIIEVCDPSLVYPKGSDRVYSCGSACLAQVQFQDGTSGQLISADMANTPSCCQLGNGVVDATACPNTYIPFYKQMKELCHDGYIYPKDDLYPGAILSCAADSDPEYTITFCPNGSGAALDPPLASSLLAQDSTPGDNADNVQGGQGTSPIWALPLQGQPV